MKKQTWRTSRKIQTGGNGFVAAIIFVLGLVALLPFWPLGVLLIIIGLLADAKYGRVHFCCYCGNQVAPTSLRCPTCGADEEHAIAEVEAHRAAKAEAAALKKQRKLDRQRHR
jgi:hypothetical protein